MCETGPQGSYFKTPSVCVCGTVGVWGQSQELMASVVLHDYICSSVLSPQSSPLSNPPSRFESHRSLSWRSRPASPFAFRSDFSQPPVRSTPTNPPPGSGTYRISLSDRSGRNSNKWWSQLPCSFPLRLWSLPTTNGATGPLSSLLALLASGGWLVIFLSFHLSETWNLVIVASPSSRSLISWK